MKFNKTGILICTLTLFFMCTMAWADTRTTAPTVKKSSTPKAATVKMPNIVVEMFAHRPAPLKEGSQLDIYITFRNKGLGTCSKNRKFKISCSILSGGGPDKKCPTPTTERTFGHEILPGNTHAVSLLGANPIFPGKYRITISFPGQKQRGRPFTKVLTVAPKFKVQKAPPVTTD